MKRYVSLIIVIGLSFMLFSCKAKEEEEIPVDEFDVFKNIVALYSVDLTNGFDYSATQTLGTNVVHKKTVEQRIDREVETKIYTEANEEYLQEFSLDDAYHQSITTTYFYRNEVGTQINDGEVSWENISLADYLASNIQLGDIRKDDFVSYDIEVDGNIQTLSGELKLSAINRLFDADTSVIEDNEIVIKIDIEKELLIEFVFHYASQETVTEILFQPYYRVANVVLPQQ